MNAALAHSELNFNFRLFAKTRSASAAWGFDRLRLFNPKWHTKIQIRRPDGTVLATQDFRSVPSFEHDFSFDLSENVANDEYLVYVAGVPVGAAFNQAFAYPTGYSATTGKNAELTYWDFSQVNIVFSGTSGRIRFENNPITNIDGASLLAAAEINFSNCQLDAETLADAIIGLDNSGISNGTFSYSGNLAAPAERALAAYNNLKDVKAWVMNGAVPADVPAYEAETTAYMTAVGIPDDGTASVHTGKTNNQVWVAIDTFIKSMKSNGLYSKLRVFYPFIGGTAVSNKWNLVDPQDTDAAHRLLWFGGWTHNELGITGNGSNSFARTYINPSLHAYGTDKLNHVSILNASDFTTVNGIETGCLGSVGALYMAIKRMPETGIILRNYGESFSTNQATPINAFYVATRDSSTSNIMYKDGGVLFSGNPNTPAAPNNYILLGVIAASNSLEPLSGLYSNRNLRAYSFGENLNSVEVQNFTTAIHQLQTDLNRPV